MKIVKEATLTRYAVTFDDGLVVHIDLDTMLNGMIDVEEYVCREALRLKDARKWSK